MLLGRRRDAWGRTAAPPPYGGRSQAPAVGHGPRRRKGGRGDPARTARRPGRRRRVRRRQSSRSAGPPDRLGRTGRLSPPGRAESPAGPATARGRRQAGGGLPRDATPGSGSRCGLGVRVGILTPSAPRQRRRCLLAVGRRRLRGPPVVAGVASAGAGSRHGSILPHRVRQDVGCDRCRRNRFRAKERRPGGAARRPPPSSWPGGPRPPRRGTPRSSATTPAPSAEDAVAATLRFACLDRGYRAGSGPSRSPRCRRRAPTVSEVVLLPGADALRPPTWVPWEERVRPGDLGVGDLLPAAPDDDRLVPGLRAVRRPGRRGRRRTSSASDGSGCSAGPDGTTRPNDGTPASSGRTARWRSPRPAHCVTCGFYLPLRGPLGGVASACAATSSRPPTAGWWTRYGCGAHSEVPLVALPATMPAVVDELILEVHARPAAAGSAADS